MLNAVISWANAAASSSVAIRVCIGSPSSVPFAAAGVPLAPATVLLAPPFVTFTAAFVPVAFAQVPLYSGVCHLYSGSCSCCICTNPPLPCHLSPLHRQFFLLHLHNSPPPPAARPQRLIHRLARAIEVRRERDMPTAQLA